MIILAMRDLDILIRLHWESHLSSLGDDLQREGDQSMTRSTSFWILSANFGQQEVHTDRLAMIQKA